MKKIYSTLCFLVLTYSATYAGPVSDYFFAEMWLKNVHSYSEVQNTKFILGNLFPSIKMLGIPNGPEEQPNTSLTDIYTNPDPFNAGTQLYYSVDRYRQQYTEELSIYSLIESYAEGHSEIFLKLLEDEILSDSILAIIAVNYFNKPADEEVLYAGAVDKVQLWHFYLSNYFSMRPSALLKYLSHSNKAFLNIPSETVKRWSLILNKVAAKPELRNYVTKLVAGVSAEFEVLSTNS